MEQSIRFCTTEDGVRIALRRRLDAPVVVPATQVVTATRAPRPLRAEPVATAPLSIAKRPKAGSTVRPIPVRCGNPARLAGTKRMEKPKKRANVVLWAFLA